MKKIAMEDSDIIIISNKPTPAKNNNPMKYHTLLVKQLLKGLKGLQPKADKAINVKVNMPEIKLPQANAMTPAADTKNVAREVIKKLKASQSKDMDDDDDTEDYDKARKIMNMRLRLALRKARDKNTVVSPSIGATPLG